MSCKTSEMQMVENLLKAVDDGEDRIDNLRLSPDELDRYSGCLLASGLVTPAHDSTGKLLLNPTAAGNALLALICDLEEVTEDSGSPSAISGCDLAIYRLQEPDIDRIQNRLTN